MVWGVGIRCIPYPWILYPAKFPPQETLPLPHPRYPTQWKPYLQILYPFDKLPSYPTPWKGHGTRDTAPKNRLTDACENITFPQLLLQAVMNRRLLSRNSVHRTFYMDLSRSAPPGVTSEVSSLKLIINLSPVKVHSQCRSRSLSFALGALCH